VGVGRPTGRAGPKVVWVLENVEGARERAEAGELLMGTMDTWVLWNLTGGVDGGVHATDVTNASRTMLMNIDTLDWNEGICADMGIPASMLPEIRPSSGVFGYGRKNGLLIDTPVAGILGDQQAATFGQACFEVGQVKNTYGTGCFMLMNTGATPVRSRNGLLTTVCYQIEGRAPVYALEGSIAVAGSLVQWLRDNLGIITESREIETLARSVDDNGGAYFVPAFSGLFAPHWRPDARGALVGLTRYVNKGHIARAVEEATAFQTREVLEAMNRDAGPSGAPLRELKVDGGMTRDELLMQFQADQIGVPVVRPRVTETTALGAAYAAGIAVVPVPGAIAPALAPGRASPARIPGRYRSTPTPLSRDGQWCDQFVTNRLEEGRFSRNPVSFAVVRGSAHHRESLTPLGLPFSDGAFVARTAQSGTTPDTRQPAPRLHHFRT